MEDRIISRLHNNPPATSDADNLVIRLAENHNDLVNRYSELINAASRLPTECKDEETAKNLTTYGLQIKACSDALESRRKLEKEPYDVLAAAVHGFFKSRIDGLDSTVNRVKILIKGYNDAVEAKRQQEAADVRRKAEAEAAEQLKVAQKLLEDAAKLQQQGLTASAEKTLEQAADAEQASIQATSVAKNVIPITPVMTRSESGGSSGSTGRWKFEVTDVNALDLESLRPYLDMDSLQKAGNKLMRVATNQIKDGEQPKQITGASIFRDSGVVLRR